MRPGVCLIPALLVAVLLTAGECRAQDTAPSEYRLKAAFLFNFAKFIEWPPESFTDAKSPFVIGVIGDNPFGSDLEETVRNKTINNRPIEVKTFPSTAVPTNSHILFICSSEKMRLPQIFESLRGSSVLTVGETEKFIESGGMINFVPEGNKIRFQINDPAAKNAKLKISSKLMSLALRPPK